jgi:hypothetical protein
MCFSKHCDFPLHEVIFPLQVFFSNVIHFINELHKQQYESVEHFSFLTLKYYELHFIKLYV